MLKTMPLIVFGTEKICGSLSYGEGVARYLLGMPGRSADSWIQAQGPSEVVT